MKRCIILLVLAAQTQVAQTISWHDSSSAYELPSGVHLFKGTSTSPVLTASYIEVDLNDPKIIVYPYLSSLSAGAENVPSFVTRVGAIAGVNGGYFGGSPVSSYSAVIEASQLVVANVQVLNRTAGTFYATRSLFSLTPARTPSVDWIYHFDQTASGIYRFAQPNPNTSTTPAPSPQQGQGTRMDSIFAAIGGGPRLIKNGQSLVTYAQEVFFESGVNGDVANPRTAVGFTADRHVILLTVDGRQASSVGVTLPELAQILLQLGCIEAMNLDGGGSTQMAVRNQYVNTPSETRAVASILAVVYADSVHYPKPVYYEKTIDADDKAQATFIGSGWFTSANAGYWGTTPAWLSPVGDGASAARFKLGLPAPASYEVQAWWVAASNRATNTPFVIEHAGGIDTVRMNQASNGSRWNVLGNYLFRGDSTDAVTVTNGATVGSYVVADGLRIVSYAPVTHVTRDEAVDIPAPYTLANFPNPFNPETVIGYWLLVAGKADLRVYDVLGREVAVLVNEEMRAGGYSVTWDARGMASGIYICQLRTGGRLLSKKMNILR